MLAQSLVRESLLASAMKHVDLERPVVCSTLTGFAFLVFTGLVSAPGVCPKCGASSDKWKVLEDSRTEMPYFFCENVLNEEVRVPTRGKKTGFKTINRKVCLFSRSWRHWSPEFKKELPHLSTSKLLRVFWHWSQMHSIEETAFDTDVHEGVQNNRNNEKLNIKDKHKNQN